MSTLILSNQDFNSTSRILNLPAPASNTEPARLIDLNTALEGLAWKDNVAAASTGNVSLTSPGATLDGVTLVSGNRILLYNQTAGAENGIYVWSGAAAALVRAYDAAVSTDFNEAIVSVDAGTVNNGQTFRQTISNPTVGTTAMVWTSFGAATPAATTVISGTSRYATQSEVDAGAVTTATVTPATLNAYASRIKKFAVAIGDGSSTSYTVTHNLATLDVSISVYQVSSGAEVLVDRVRATTNTATISFAAAPASGAYRVVVIG